MTGHRSVPPTGIPRRSFLLGFAGAAGLAIAGCGTNTPAARTPAPIRQIGRYASANPGSVNTFWFDAPQGLVLVDAQRTISDARKAIAMIRQTGRPVAAVLITHSHPDHVGGLGVFHQEFPSAPVYASAATTAVMREDPRGFYPLTKSQLGDDFPAKITLPDRPFEPNSTIDVAGVRLNTAHFGPGESDVADVYFEPVTSTLFCGDLASNKATPAVLEGHSCGWLTNLHQLANAFPRIRSVYPGHGNPGDRNLIDAQIQYLQQLRDLVKGASNPPGSVSPAAAQSVVATMNRRYPNYPSVASLPNMAQLNIAAVAKELTAETGCCCGTS